MRTLIVDDELISREKLQTILLKYGECVCAQTGEAAAQEFKQAWQDWKPFDLVLLDVGLPDRTGVEVLHELRGMEELHGVAQARRAKIAMVTSSADRGVVQQCVMLGCDEYIVKPISPTVIGRKMTAMGLA